MMKNSQHIMISSIIIIIGIALYLKTQNPLYAVGGCILGAIYLIPKLIKVPPPKPGTVSVDKDWQERKKKRNRIIGAVIIGQLLFFALFVVIYKLVLSPKVTGSFEALGGNVGVWTLEPDHCYSGLREGFLGVDLDAAKDDVHGVRAVQDAVQGLVVKVYSPETGPDGFSFHKENCQILELNLEPTGVRFNNVPGVKGSLNIDCGDFKGQVTFSGCYF